MTARWIFLESDEIDLTRRTITDRPIGYHWPQMHSVIKYEELDDTIFEYSRRRFTHQMWFLIEFPEWVGRNG